MMMVSHIYKGICKVMAVVGMTLSMACSCGKSADYVEPPHIVAPELPVEPTYEKGEGVIRLVSYNVGLFTKYTGKYTNTIDMVAKMMLELQADAVCLNELDSCTTRTNKIFQSYELAKKMGNWHHSQSDLFLSLPGSSVPFIIPRSSVFLPFPPLRV